MKVGDSLFQHESVLKKEVLEGLNIRPEGVYIDCTVGGGGHSEGILSQLNKDGLLIAFDQDQEAIQAASKRLEPYKNQTIFIHSNFRNLQKEVRKLNVDRVDGILFDLGVSSPQFDQAERGFSYRFDATLDMRMDRSQQLSAYQIVNEWSYEKLVSILFRYGEERFAKQIARKIEQARKTKEISTTFELVELIKDAIPARARRTGGHPAKRTFQALRIAVNKELSSLRDALHQAAQLVQIRGRIAVITFHSLEDRLCKNIFQKWSTPKEIPRNLPIIPAHHQAPFKRINRKPIVPSEKEIEMNRRSRSAKLRIVEKVSEWDDDFKQ